VKRSTVESSPTELPSWAQFVRHIEELARHRGISQKKLLSNATLGDNSKAVGTTQFASWKNGETSPTIEKLEALCRVIEKRLTLLLDPPERQQQRAGGLNLNKLTREMVAVMESLDTDEQREEVLELALKYKRAWGGSSHPSERAAEGSPRHPHSK
jgi:transcriptional regulator with XRE-family HTH domain